MILVNIKHIFQKCVTSYTNKALIPVPEEGSVCESGVILGQLWQKCSLYEWNCVFFNLPCRTWLNWAQLIFIEIYLHQFTLNFQILLQFIIASEDIDRFISFNVEIKFNIDKIIQTTMFTNMSILTKIYNKNTFFKYKLKSHTKFQR